MAKISALENNGCGICCCFSFASIFNRSLLCLCVFYGTNAAIRFVCFSFSCTIIRIIRLYRCDLCSNEMKKSSCGCCCCGYVFVVGVKINLTFASPFFTWIHFQHQSHNWDVPQSILPSHIRFLLKPIIHWDSKRKKNYGVHSEKVKRYEFRVSQPPQLHQQFQHMVYLNPIFASS